MSSIDSLLKPTWLNIAENICGGANAGTIDQIELLVRPLLESIDFNESKSGTESYGRNILLSNSEYEVMLAVWRPYSECAPHDHGFSTGMVYVIEGVFAEYTFVKNDNNVWLRDTESLLVAQKGDQIKVDIGGFHSMKNMSEIGITLHFYTPAVENMKVIDLNKKEIITVVSDCGAWVPEDKNKIISRQSWK